MAKSFTITTTATDILKADARGQAQALFTVTNRTQRPLRGMARAKAQGDTKREWLSVAGESERDFGGGATEQFTVNFDAAGAPAGKYPFRLDVASSFNPDEDFTEGPTVNVEIAGPPPPPPPKPGGFPKWIIFLIIGVVLLIAGIILFFVLRGNGDDDVEPTPTPTPVATATATPVATPTSTPTPPEIANRCETGYVWREARPGDTVCVTPAIRAQTQEENRLAASRRSPTGGPYGPDTCLPGFVWREAFPGDVVCVPGSSRDQARHDNARNQR